MITKAMVVTVLVLCALIAPWAVDRSVAAPLPDYFADEWVAFACVNDVKPGGSTTPVLLQLNFDKLAGSGIALARADSLFARMTSSLGWLSQIIGPNLQVTCTFKPSQVQSMVSGVTALQAAVALAGSFQGNGFASYFILDAFPSLAPSYLGSDIVILRTDAFHVLGPNNVSYMGSHDLIDSLTQ
jgi:hypothetical protein